MSNRMDATHIDAQLITKNKEKYRKIYDKTQKDGIIVTAEWNCGCEWDQVKELEDAEEDYKVRLEIYNQNCRAVKAGFDNIPYAVFDFWGAAWLMALAYGCKLLKNKHLINAAPLFYDTGEAMKMKKRDGIFNYGLYPVITERIIEFQKRWGEVPITASDIQSPIDVATCIFHSEEAMIAMFDEKDAVHHILEIVTGSIIEILRFQERLINNFAGFRAGGYIPYGIHVSDDDAAFLSPATYSEFAVPYNERLSDEFGGIAFHCCMRYAQNLENMSATKGFMALDATTDFNPEDRILSAIRRKGVWTAGNYSNPGGRELDREKDEAYLKRLIDITEGQFSMEIAAIGKNEEEALTLADRVKEYAMLKGRLVE